MEKEISNSDLIKACIVAKALAMRGAREIRIRADLHQNVNTLLCNRFPYTAAVTHYHFGEVVKRVPCWRGHKRLMSLTCCKY